MPIHLGMDADALQSSSPSGSRRRRLVWLVLALIVAVGAVVSLNVMITMRRETTEMLDELFKPLSPPRQALCTDTMEASCARAAAERTGTTVAWLDKPDGYELAWLFATHQPVSPDEGVIAVQYFVGSDGHGMIEVVTSVPPIPAEQMTPSKSVSNGEDTATVWQDDGFGILSLEWTHDGIVYVLTAQPRPWDPGEIIDVWKTVRYATPPPTKA